MTNAYYLDCTMQGEYLQLKITRNKYYYSLQYQNLFTSVKLFIKKKQDSKQPMGSGLDLLVIV